MVVQTVASAIEASLPVAVGGQSFLIQAAPELSAPHWCLVHLSLLEVLQDCSHRLAGATTTGASSAIAVARAMPGVVLRLADSGILRSELAFPLDCLACFGSA